MRKLNIILVVLVIGGMMVAAGSALSVFSAQPVATGTALVDAGKIEDCTKKPADQIKDCINESVGQIKEVTNQTKEKVSRPEPVTTPGGEFDRIINDNSQELLKQGRQISVSIPLAMKLSGAARSSFIRESKVKRLEAWDQASARIPHLLWD